MTAFKWLRFGEGHTSTDVCRCDCDKPATGIALVCGWFPIKACDHHAEELRMKSLTAEAEEKDKAFAAQEFIA